MTARLRSIVTLSALVLQLCGCASDQRNKATMDELERRHTVMMETMGGSGM